MVWGHQIAVLLLHLDKFQRWCWEIPVQSLDSGWGREQVSIISPILYNIYMTQLGEVILGFGVRCHQYVDDTLLYLFCPLNATVVVENLEEAGN